VSDDLSGYPGAPPGWYPDPAGGPGQRWWDGYAWTDATVQPEVPPPPPAPPQPQSSVPPSPGPYPYWVPAPPDAADVVRREEAMTPTARIAVAFFGLSVVVTLINLQLRRTQFRALGHQIRIIYDASRNGAPVPTFTSQSTTDPLQVIFSLAVLVAFILALIWQFRAASAARALGFRATHSPGWGVGCWFVPVVNLWMPYQALRDCLPHDDPHRPLVLRCWLLAIAAQFLAQAALAAALFSSPVALVISIPAGICAIGLVATAPRVVVAISTAHRTAIDRPRPL
jgi:hypothetical protein